ncbi:hypothetical protein QFZ43_006547 [Streptomyces afghaniensis]|nr:hypothetical protein [Streptomyces afghaniensis]
MKAVLAQGAEDVVDGLALFGQQPGGDLDDQLGVVTQPVKEWGSPRTAAASLPSTSSLIRRTAASSSAVSSCGSGAASASKEASTVRGRTAVVPPRLVERSR